VIELLSNFDEIESMNYSKNSCTST